MGGLMKKELILILVTILLMASAYCPADEPDSKQDNVKTGDIMVVARSCIPPPYETGLKLILNKIPDNVSKTIVTSFPDSLIGNSDLPRMLEKEYGYALNGHLDTANGVIVIIRSNLYHDDYRIADGITDSLGRYVFANMPIGNYQLILSGILTLNSKSEFEKSNRLFGQRTDFPEWNLDYPSIPKEKFNNNPAIAGEPPLYQIHCADGIIDSIRVAPDSVSIAKIHTIIYSDLQFFINRASIWNKECKPRDGHNEKRNKR
jgi:hypothetical protein